MNELSFDQMAAVEGGGYCIPADVFTLEQLLTWITIGENGKAYWGDIELC